jgi:N-acetylglucosamine-6-sulfatase
MKECAEYGGADCCARRRRGTSTVRFRRTARRARLVTLMLLGVAVPTVALPSTAAAQTEGAQHVGRPNVVVVVVDDLSERMYAHSAALRRSGVAAGASFDNAVAPTPLCCPARSTILTGRYAHHHGVRQNRYAAQGTLLYGAERRFRERGLERKTVAFRLRRSGYTTSLIGKYLNGYGDSDGGPHQRASVMPDEPSENGSFWTYVPRGWSDWHGLAANGINDNGRLSCVGNCSSVEPTRDGAHQTDVLRRRTIRFLTAQGRSRRPFFLYVADEIPHGEHPPADRYAHSHDGASPPPSPSVNEHDTSDKPGYIARDVKLSPRGVRPWGCAFRQWPITYPTKDVDCWASIDYSRHVWENGLEGLESVADLYASIVRALRTTGQLDNTYILFLSDNGVHIGEHRQPYGKNTPYREDVDVPLTVRGPGVPRGKRSPHLVGLQDIAPTVLNLARVPVPGDMDGRSLKPLLTASPGPTGWRKRLGIEGYRAARYDVPRPAYGDTPTWRGLITSDGRKYVAYSTGETELYRLSTDPYELTNEATSASPGELFGLHALTQQLGSCRDARSCAEAEGR